MRNVPHKDRAGLDLVSLVLHGKKAGFEKVIGMIDSMLTNFQKEQVDDDNKKAYCGRGKRQVTGWARGVLRVDCFRLCSQGSVGPGQEQAP